MKKYKIKKYKEDDYIVLEYKPLEWEKYKIAIAYKERHKFEIAARGLKRGIALIEKFNIKCSDDYEKLFKGGQDQFVDIDNIELVVV